VADVITSAAPLARRRRLEGRRLRLVRGPVAWTMLAVVLSCATLALLAPLLPLADPGEQDITASLGGFSGEHWLGTDQYGRDLLSRLIWGTRTSLVAAVIAVGVAAAVGIPLGLVAGYTKGWADWLLGRLADMTLTVPALVMLITVQAALQTGLNGQMVVLGLLFAPRVLRVVRSATVTVVEAPFVVAGRLAGCSHARILRKYILPNVREQVIVQVSYLLSIALVVETGISFLGIGVQAPDASLGSLLDGGIAMLVSRPEVILIPAGVTVLLILAFNILGDHAIDGGRDD
jgi:peptide/nickel transport system permease protein